MFCAISDLVSFVSTRLIVVFLNLVPYLATIFAPKQDGRGVRMIGDSNELDALADTIQIGDITSNEGNADILSRVKHNDHSFTALCITNYADNDYDVSNYCPEGSRDMEWLGYYVGKNSHLEELYFQNVESFNDFIEPFCRGLKSNKSIQSLGFGRSDLSESDIFQLMGPFVKDNPNLIDVAFIECHMGAEGWRSLSLILSGRTDKSLKFFRLDECEIDDESLGGIISSLSGHPQLETLNLLSSGMGRSGCMALSTLLQQGTSELHELNLTNNNIDDEGVDHLTLALIENGKLRDLNLSWNSSITIRGWRALSTLLEAPNSQLQDLSLPGNEIDDEGAVIFATALTNNCTLERLDLYNNPSRITTNGWAVFSKLLCDTSSVDRTHLSNHTLKSIGANGLPSDLVSSLKVNRGGMNKKRVAFIKILKHHDDFNMLPFFKWDLKVLPLALEWFKGAKRCTTNADIKKRKLSVIFQYVRDMSWLCDPSHADAGCQMQTD